MRACFLWAAAAVMWSLLSGPATAQEKNTVLEGAQKFCAAEYGDRLLGVTMEGEDGFACRFAAVEKVASYKLEPTEPEPNKWDLDEEEETAAAAAAKATAAAKLKRRKVKLRKKRRYKRAKLRKRKRLQRKRRIQRSKKRDPFAEFMRKVRRATSKKRSEVKRKLKKRGLAF